VVGPDSIDAVLVVRLELPGPHENAGEAVPLSADHVGLDVVADHDGVLRGGAETAQRRGEERLGRLAHDGRADAGRLLQPREDAPASSERPSAVRQNRLACIASSSAPRWRSANTEFSSA
jgi:hypothetical protein